MNSYIRSDPGWTAGDLTDWRSPTVSTGKGITIRRCCFRNSEPDSLSNKEGYYFRFELKPSSRRRLHAYIYFFYPLLYTIVRVCKHETRIHGDSKSNGFIFVSLRSTRSFASRRSCRLFAFPSSIFYIRPYCSFPSVSQNQNNILITYLFIYIISCQHTVTAYMVNIANQVWVIYWDYRPY